MSTKRLHTLAKRLSEKGYSIERTRDVYRPGRLLYRLRLAPAYPVLHCYSTGSISVSWVTADWLDLRSCGITIAGPGYRSGKHWPLEDVDEALAALRDHIMRPLYLPLDETTQVMRHHADFPPSGERLWMYAEQIDAIMRVRAWMEQAVRPGVDREWDDSIVETCPAPGSVAAA